MGRLVKWYNFGLQNRCREFDSLIARHMHFFDISYIINVYGYIGIFIIIFLESGIFPPLPGDSLLFTAGLLAATSGFNIYLLVLLVFVASFLGIVSGYHLGMHLPKLERFVFFKKVFRPEYIDRAHKFFIDHGKLAIILSRFVPIIRTFVPVAAGIARMDYYSFIKYSIIGSVLWSGTFILGGYFLGKIFPQIHNYLTLIIILVVFVSVLPGIFEIMRKRH